MSTALSPHPIYVYITWLYEQEIQHVPSSTPTSVCGHNTPSRYAIHSALLVHITLS